MQLHPLPPPPSHAYDPEEGGTMFLTNVRIFNHMVEKSNKDHYLILIRMLII